MNVVTRVVCAWCSKLLSTARTGDRPDNFDTILTSHGICDGCRKTMVEPLAEQWLNSTLGQRAPHPATTLTIRCTQRKVKR